ncbi:methyl-accepting chemotaxis protein McpB [mine drainage metagenome]|jgi:methyl-accepting chemotaxis protein|uniref:Methyl-accepting chemotaxis protein McpB n=1 Tax=mine drainage metagenome TaxID=410659 RepID=A0A1J5QF34_9ZZZZ
MSAQLAPGFVPAEMQANAWEAQLRLCQDALTLLNQQFEGARGQMEAGVLDLSQRFAALYGSLENAVRASGDAAGDAGHGMNAVFDASRDELHQVVTVMREAFSRRDAAVQQVQAVTVHASALRTMVDRVAQLAAKTDLLALNATIEASRAGPHGRGFSIVAEEVRKLSAQSRETSREMNERVGAITAEIRAMAEQAARSSHEERETFATSEATLQGVLKRLQDLAQAQGESAAILRDEGERMRQEISQVIVALQFGDRVNQIITHANASLAALADEVAGALTDPARTVDGEGFMRGMANGYTTDEQRSRHLGLEQDDGSDAGGEITFF